MAVIRYSWFVFIPHNWWLMMLAIRQALTASWSLPEFGSTRLYRVHVLWTVDSLVVMGRSLLSSNCGGQAQSFCRFRWIMMLAIPDFVWLFPHMGRSARIGDVHMASGEMEILLMYFIIGDIYNWVKSQKSKLQVWRPPRLFSRLIQGIWWKN